MRIYRKRPVAVQAIQYTKDTCNRIHEVLEIPHEYREGICGVFAIRIETLNGPVDLQPNEWLIRGVKGEYYPCDPEIFEQTYEEVRAEENFVI